MEREFPEQYSKPVIKVLKAISLGVPNVVGSSADHRILFSADYDLMESVVLSRKNVEQFQKKIKNMPGKITDIKIGEISEWNLLKKPYIKNGNVKDYKQKDELAHLSSLWQKKLITHDEFMTASEILKPHLTAVEYLNAKKELRFGLLRWSTSEVQQGYKDLRNNKIIYLEDAFKSKGITKIDIIAWITNKYVELSNIIFWTNRSGKPYPHLQSVKRALEEDILLFEAEGNYIKVAKRMYSLAKQYKDKTVQDAISTILNSPLGMLYMLTADLEVLEEFPEAVTQARKRKQLDLLKDYFAKLYFPELNKAIPNLKLLPKLTEILQRECKLELEKHKLLPIPRDYRI
jgi:hypothetical protein